MVYFFLFIYLFPSYSSLPSDLISYAIYGGACNLDLFVYFLLKKVCKSEKSPMNKYKPSTYNGNFTEFYCLQSRRVGTIFTFDHGWLYSVILTRYSFILVQKRRRCKNKRMLSFFLFPLFSLACFFQARWTYWKHFSAEKLAKYKQYFNIKVVFLGS